MSLRDTIHKEIESESYVCLVCHNEIGANSEIWSCRRCFRSFDINCARAWAKKDSAHKTHWRCPHCLIPQDQKPSSIRYRCWCRKVARPSKDTAKHKSRASFDSSSMLDPIPPHSCGQTCGAKRDCPHPCPLPCHAGPHLPVSECMYPGPVVRCFCGKHQDQTICSLTKRQGYSCDDTCELENPVCGHQCQRRCHPLTKSRGKPHCGPCREKINVKCFCGRAGSTKRLCRTLKNSERAQLKGNASSDALISCGRECGQVLGCGHHRCSRACHETSEHGHACPDEPFEGETCHCGKELAHRKDCRDSRVSCGKICGKLLDCGHACKDACHSGPCGPCPVVLDAVRCRCGKTTQSITCSLRQHSKPTCANICNEKLNCSRHRCKQVCCEFCPRKESSQSSAKRKGRSTTPMSLFEFRDSATERRLHTPAISAEEVSDAETAAHFCPKVCGKPLTCKKHFCTRTCHDGKCPPCLEASFEEWRCPCGDTVVVPPIRCGAAIASCSSACHRPQECGHRAQHVCHSDEIPCPPCPLLVPVTCRCTKSKISVACPKAHGSTPLCMEPCQRRLQCGHICKQVCCPGGDACLSCQEACQSQYPCGHKHVSRCHWPYSCPDICNQTLIASCPCGVLQCDYQCGEDLEIGCNETCIRESYPISLLEFYKGEVSWCSRIEAEIRAFVKDTSKKSLWFKPMRKSYRRALYMLIEHYKLRGQSVDEGANRSVCAYKTESTWLPQVLLSSATEKRPDVSLDISDIDSEDDESNGEKISEVKDVGGLEYVEIPSPARLDDDWEIVIADGHSPNPSEDDDENEDTAYKLRLLSLSKSYQLLDDTLN